MICISLFCSIVLTGQALSMDTTIQRFWFLDRYGWPVAVGPQWQVPVGGGGTPVAVAVGGGGGRRSAAAVGGGAVGGRGHQRLRWRQRAAVVPLRPHLCRREGMIRGL